MEGEDGDEADEEEEQEKRRQVEDGDFSVHINTRPYL